MRKDGGCKQKLQGVSGVTRAGCSVDEMWAGLLGSVVGTWVQVCGYPCMQQEVPGGYCVEDMGCCVCVSGLLGESWC